MVSTTKFSTCLFITLLINLISFIGQAQSNDKGILTVNISNIENKNGTIRVNIYRKGDDIFGTPYLLKLINADINGLLVKFKELPFSQYVVYVFHDENNDKNMDHRFGLPMEPFGYSNDWKLTLFSGMPSFKKTKFTFSKENTIVNIKLK